MTAVPDGFELHTRTSPLTAPWEPIYARRHAERYLLALEIRTAHTNSRGLLHGGLIAALADNAMGLSLGEMLAAEGRPATRGAITTSLSIDYLDRADIGEWLVFTTGFIHAGKRTAVTEAIVTAGDRVIVRANAAFAFS
ncbi:MULTISPECIES: PaaI family thioesterase [unclassified Sphingomonas]|jgi:uncharacterized protein (TIGR00369 family)|uniref:PaaI family thioesterase n=1 Tax=unclassified Sphingomonas TaxID=196159 RepID=UPI000E10B1E4|nr:PaaI family thioesterase [Sphingomonas sp. FARSPH]AXJ96462.1 thioesterase [Sphingomonas sp. FARSPH]